MKLWQIFACLLILSAKRNSMGAPDPGENAQEFGVLCSIAEMASQQPQLCELDESINATSLQEDINHFEMLTSPTSDDSAAKPNPEWVKKNMNSNQSLRGAENGPLLKKIREVASRLSESCRQYESRKKSIKKDVMELLKKGVFGEEASEATDVANPTEISDQSKVFVSAGEGSSASYARSCASSVQQVGKTLVNDLFCLCVGKSDTDGPQVCAETIKGDDNQVWPQINSDQTMPKSWQTIYDKCPKPGLKLTAQNIRNAIQTFQGMLGKHATKSTYSTGITMAPFFFGKAAVDADCKGATSGNLCVNYKAAMTQNSEKGIRGIAWVAKYLDAAREIDDFERVTEKCEADYNQLLVLYHHAQALFQQAVRDSTGRKLGDERGPKDEMNQQAKPHTSAATSASDSNQVGMTSSVKFPVPVKFIFFISLLA